MSITSLTFFTLVLVSIVLYYTIAGRVQWIFLSMLSAGFVYISSGFNMLLVLCAEVTIAYIGAYLIKIQKKQWTKRLVLLIAMGCIIGALFFFRDMEFINVVKRAYAAITSKSVEFISYKVWGPIGISYLTLSLLGYILDIYWEKYEVETNPFRIFLFASYYPQLTSGPIVRYDFMKPQFIQPHRFNPNGVLRGGQRILWGCIMKMVIADRAGALISPMYDNPSDYAGIIWVFVILIYALQIYTDFAGCMHIVLGVSECYGITLPENFNSPFLSQSMSEFWRRWHITMGAWFKDYVMYPLLKSGGMQRLTKKCKTLFGKQFGKRIVACMSTWVVWITIGLWHGGSLKFILASGLLPGMYVVCGELLAIPMEKITKKLNINRESLLFRLLGRFRILILMSINWIFVRTLYPAQGVFVLGQMFSKNYIANPIFAFDGSIDGIIALCSKVLDCLILIISVISLIYIAIRREKGVDLREKFNNHGIVYKYIMLLIGIFTVIIFGVYGPGFDASSFIYKQF